MAGKIVLSTLLVLAIIYFVPFVIYSLLYAVRLVKTPEGPPGRFLLGVLVSKVGTAVAFVLIFYITREALDGRWLLYAGLWWIMFILGEAGQAIGPDYTWREAGAGMISETIYCPLAAWTLQGLIPPA